MIASFPQNWQTAPASTMVNLKIRVAKSQKQQKAPIMQQTPAQLDPSKKHQINTICVFCGSGHGHNSTFQKCATNLGRFLAEQNYHLVYGGGDMGLMGSLAQSALDHGGKVTGIIPQFLLRYQHGIFQLENQIVTSNMHERKAKMYELADAYIALPGGIGTLEELVETMTWEQLGQHKKPIILLNPDQFWDPFLDLLAHMKQHNFIRAGLEVNFHVLETIEQLTPILNKNKSSIS